MGTVVLWPILFSVGMANRRFCIDRAEQLGIEVKDLKKVKSEPFDFLYDISMGIILLIIIKIQPQINISSILAVILLVICLVALVCDIRRLSNKEAE